MYKTIDIADVIGTAINEFDDMNVFPMESIIMVFKKVNIADRFIRLEYSQSALLRVEDLANERMNIENNTITFKQIKSVKNRFVNSYYSLDRDTKLLLEKIVKEVFGHE